MYLGGTGGTGSSAKSPDHHSTLDPRSTPPLRDERIPALTAGFCTSIPTRRLGPEPLAHLRKMIGAADWLADGRFRVRQLTTTTMGSETAMLRTFSTWLQPNTVLVSHNGKGYDSPLLKTRYRLARLPDPLSGPGHLDPLHPVRRHWKDLWEICRLATAERKLLAVVRKTICRALRRRPFV